MEQWLELWSKYLHILLDMEGRPSTPTCCMCNNYGDIKCSECFGAPLFCRECCLRSHRHFPFHRPLLWTTTHYTLVSLHSLGYVMFIGHDGFPCPQTVEVCQIQRMMSCIWYLHRGSKLEQFLAMHTDMDTHLQTLLHQITMISKLWHLLYSSLPLVSHDSQMAHTNYWSSLTVFLTI